MARLQTAEKKAVAQQTLAQVVGGASFQEQLRRALPKQLSVDRFARVILTQIRRVPHLADCSPQSFFGAVIEAGQLGLEPGVLGQCWILPYWNNKLNSYEATLIVGYRGMVQLAYRSSQVKGVWAREVYEGEHFVWVEGLHRRLEHTPSDTTRDPKRITHVYAICETAMNGVLCDVMVRSEVDAIKARARAKDYGPWTTDFAEMAKKTVLRRLLKVAPASAELQRALDLEEKADRGEAQDLGSEASDVLTMQPAPIKDTQPQEGEGKVAPGGGAVAVPVPAEAKPSTETEAPTAPAQPDPPQPAKARGKAKAAPEPEEEIDPDTGEVIPAWVGRRDGEQA